MNYINNRDDMCSKNFNNIFFICIISLFYNFNSIVNIAIIILIVSIVIKETLNNSILIYLALTPWEFVFSLGIGSLSLIIQIIIVYKILLYVLKRGKLFAIRKRHICLIFILSVYGVIGLLYNKTLSSIGLVPDAIIISYLFNVINEKYELFWDYIFKSYVISCVFGCLYGIMHNAFLPRWLPGIGYVRQFCGTIGTSRMAIFINISILFVIFIKMKKIYKGLLLIYLYYMLFITISMSGIVTNLLMIICIYFYNIYLKYKNISNRRDIIKLLTKPVIAILILIFLSLSVIKLKDYFPVINNMITRVDSVYKDFKDGNLDAATSGRNEISDIYMTEYEKLNLFNKFFGLGSATSVEYIKERTGFDNYSHNSMIDLLFFGGIFMLIIFIMYLGNDLRIQKKGKYFNIIVIMKGLLLISSLNVSILNAGFFYIWILI